jgi:diguanylate cyclase (GGDEF)-like protein/PAS domain S-box-containing protein
MFFVATLVGAGILLAFVLGQVYREAGRQAETDARNVAGVLEARLNATLRRVHADLDHLAATLPMESLKPEAVGIFRDRLGVELARYAAKFPEIVGYRVIDVAGDVLYASEANFSPGNAADRRYFTELAKSPALGLTFSEVIVGRITGRAMLIMAVPIRDAAGVFRGVVMAPLDLGYMQKMFDAVNLGANGVITFRRSDNGQLAVRRPTRPEAVNQTLTNNPMHMRIEAGEKAGSIRYRAALDGVERIYAYQRIGDYPFYVAAGIAAEDYLAGWRKLVAVAGISSLLLVLVLSLLLIRLLRAEGEEATIAQRLSESEARYRLLAENSHDVIWTLDIPSRRFTYVSPSVLALRGYTPQEVLGQTMEGSLTPESAARVAREIDQRLRRIAAGDRAAQVVTSELEQLCKDGSVVSTEVVSSYLLDKDGVARTILGITRNVSERKAAERALLESNRQLQARIEEIGQLQIALQELAVRDGLTALYNRRYLDETLEREVSRARREGNPLSLVMLDIDHFKRVNDTYGHQAGDEVLRVLAATLMADIRTEDIACRYGGEEFLILLPGMPLASAMERAERWRKSVEELSIAHGHLAIGFTISLGVAAYPEHGKTPDDLTRCADQALYRAKHEGRNRVVMFAA